MEEPVIANDGNTYERATLLAWFSENKTSPVTGEEIATSFIPNKNLERLILKFKEEAKEKELLAEKVINDAELLADKELKEAELLAEKEIKDAELLAEQKAKEAELLAEMEAKKAKLLAEKEAKDAEL